MDASSAMNVQVPRRFLRYAGWVCIVTIAVLSLSPRRLGVGSEFGAPELDHLFAYLVTTALLALGHRLTRSRVLICALLIGFGGLMELGQGLIPGRHANVEELLVNAVGVGMGLVTAMILERTMLPRAWR